MSAPYLLTTPYPKRECTNQHPGISGINFAHRLQEKNPELSYITLEGRHEIGGTWSLFIYAGARTGYLFCSLLVLIVQVSALRQGYIPLDKAPESIAKVHLIVQHLKDSAAEMEIDRRILYNRSVQSAKWSSKQKAWTLRVLVDRNYTVQNYCRFLMLCTGYYDCDEALQASFPGIEQFQRPMVHSQFWKSDLEYIGKRVVGIGSDATAITLLPALTDDASHSNMLQRSSSYVLSIPHKDGIRRLIRKWFRPPMQDWLMWYSWLLIPVFFVSI